MTVVAVGRLLAAFQTLRSKYTGEGELTVGTPIAGRNRVGVENLIGFFVNTLVMKDDLRGIRHSRIFKSGTEAPLRALFDSPTIDGISKVIVASQINRVDSRRVEERVNKLKRLSPQEISALLVGN